MHRLSISIQVASFVLLSALLAAPASSLQRTPAAIPEAHGALQVLAIPADLPDVFGVEVEHGGARHLLELRRHSLRAPGFRLQAWTELGGLVEVEPPPPATYRGRVLGRPGSAVVADLSPAGLTARVMLSPGERFHVAPLDGDPIRRSDPRGVLHRVAGGDLPELQAACGVDACPACHAGGAPGRRAPNQLHAGGGCLQRAEIAFDADFEYYQAQGSTVAGTMASVDAHLNAVDFFYARDLLVTYELTLTIVRTFPFYTPTDGGDLLDLFVSEWNTTQAGVPRDMAHLMTGKSGSLIEYGGLAYVGAVCHSFAYGWSMDSSGIVGHELGHNWGAGHCHDEEPCNNMCGACLYIAPNTKAVKEAYIATLSCLEDAPPHATSMPPYVLPESFSLAKSELASLTSLGLDVLANDHDGNCDVLSVVQVDATSALGVPLSVSPGTSPQGLDEVVYAPVYPLAGADSFGYVVDDGWGNQEAGTATVEITPSGLLGYWKLDETGGATAADSTAHGADGLVLGSAQWGSSQFGGGLVLDGVDDSVRVPALGLDGNRATLCAWVRSSSSQSNGTGIMFSRAGGTVAGLHFGPGNQLSYTWSVGGSPTTWNSGLVVNQGVWSFVAVVIEPDRATLYLYDGAFQVASVAAAHDKEAFGGDLYLGRDPQSASLHFAGRLDEARFYAHSFKTNDVRALVRAGGLAVAPTPLDGGSFLPLLGADLTWEPSLKMASQDVYFGSSYPGVLGADTGSPLFQGNQLASAFAPPALTSPGPWFWRVDEHIGQMVLPGDVWQFDVTQHGHWRLDESAGIGAADSGVAGAGTYIGSPNLGQPGVSAATGTSVEFDGVDDEVVIQALDLNSNQVTISAWINREPGQIDWAGLVFSRSGSTVAGLHLGTAHELRYTWNDDSATYDWDSGLLTPRWEWVFTALVVEPEQATLYLGDGGVLSSAVNPVPHEPEAFDSFTEIARDLTAGRYYRGRIDDVRIYDQALTPAQIQALYSATQ